MVTWSMFTKVNPTKSPAVTGCVSSCSSPTSGDIVHFPLRHAQNHKSSHCALAEVNLHGENILRNQPQPPVPRQLWPTCPNFPPSFCFGADYTIASLHALRVAIRVALPQLLSSFWMDNFQKNHLR